VLSTAMTAWAAKCCNSRDLLGAKRPDFLPEDDDYCRSTTSFLSIGTPSVVWRTAELDYHVGDGLSAGVGVAHLLCSQQAAIRAVPARAGRVRRLLRNSPKAGSMPSVTIGLNIPSS